MPRYAHIIGWGKYVPPKVMTNNDIAKTIDTSDEWIRERTGIGQRRIALPKESTAVLSLYAAREAMDVANVNPGEIDLIIVATATPDYLLPATACLVQDGLGADHAGAFDLEAGCSGFVYGLCAAAGMIRSGMYNTILVVGAETLSRFVDWSDRGTCVLFGDGAGAVVLRGSEQPGGVMASVLGSDGSGAELLIIPGGGSKNPAGPETLTSGLHYIKMSGREVYRFAVKVMVQASRQVAQQAGWGLNDVDLFIPHQANQRIIESATKTMKIPPDKVFSDVECYGNTSAASIPIALCEAFAAGRIRSGDKLLLVGFGAGFTWAACALEWSAPKPGTPAVQHAVVSRLRYNWFGVRSLLARLLRRLDATTSKLLEFLERRPPER